ncbi:MAG TPA: uroporphyrinogen-III synthase [Acidimicrobiia bacterium]|nr:uroporphyrinogen-III synthase [Acidimicrobiia bacterium]
MRRPRCALTTTAERAGDLVETVEAHGLEAVLLPCIEVTVAPSATLETVRAAANQADWLVFTSARAVTSIWPEGGMPDVPALVVGAGTGEAVRKGGGSVSIQGEGGAGDLLDRHSEPLAGKKVLFAHGASADPSTLHRLEAMAAEVTALAVYETRSVPPGSDPVDVALFASPSAVGGWAISRRFDDVILAAIGATTAAALTSQGHPPHIVSPRPDHHPMIQTVARHLSDWSPV